jgi:hypothetical protein
MFAMTESPQNNCIDHFTSVDHDDARPICTGEKRRGVGYLDLGIADVTRVTVRANTVFDAPEREAQSSNPLAFSAHACQHVFATRTGLDSYAGTIAKQLPERRPKCRRLGVEGW